MWVQSKPLCRTMKADGLYTKMEFTRRAGSSTLTLPASVHNSNSFVVLFNILAFSIAVVYSFVCLVDLHCKRLLYYNRYNRNHRYGGTHPMGYGELTCAGVLTATVCGFSSGISLGKICCVVAIMSFVDLVDIYWVRSARYSCRQLMAYGGPSCVGIVAAAAYGFRVNSLTIIAFAMASTTVLFGSVNFSQDHCSPNSPRFQLVCGGLIYLAIWAVAVYVLFYLT
jgi:hypothetical protein